MPEGLHLGRNCRWLDGAVRQQCVGHLPFARRATVNGGFSILPTGSTDPQETFIISVALRQVSELTGPSFANL